MFSNHHAVFFVVLSSGPVVYSLYLMIFKSTPKPSTTAAREFEKFPLFDHYSSSQGYTREYMEELVNFLAKKQILAKYSCNEGQIFQLFILRGQESKAKNFVARFHQTVRKTIGASQEMNHHS